MSIFLKVNGGWGDWNEWQTCQVSCGGGYQNRTRTCDNPTPQFEGEDCTVDGSLEYETQKCNENPCPSTQLSNIPWIFEIQYIGNLMFNR